MLGFACSAAITRAASSARASSVSAPSSPARADEAVDDRQVEIGVLRAVLVDDHAALVDEIQCRR